MIKIRYTDLPEGLHVDVKSEGPNPVIYLARALSREERRAALSKARQAARVGRSAPLHIVPLAFAICADEVKTTLRSTAAAARVHPVSFAVPTAIIVTAAALYAFVTSVTIHLTGPAQAFGHRHGGLPPGAAAARSPGQPQPQPQPQPVPGASAGASAGGRAGPAGTSDQQSPPSPLPSLAGSAGSSSPGAQPGGAAGRLPSPAVTSTGDTSCVQVGPVKVCMHLRATL